MLPALKCQRHRLAIASVLTPAKATKILIAVQFEIVAITIAFDAMHDLVRNNKLNCSYVYFRPEIARLGRRETEWNAEIQIFADAQSEKSLFVVVCVVVYSSTTTFAKVNASCDQLNKISEKWDKVSVEEN